MRKLIFISMLSIVLAGIVSKRAEAQAPLLLHHQGRILDSSGQAISGTQALIFKIYSSATASSELWSETVTVSVQNGYFSAILGLNTQLKNSIFEKNPELYLGVTVGNTGQELKPRIRLVSVPYALVARTSQNVRGGVVDVKEIKVGGKVVVDSKGTWKGPSSGLQGPPGASCKIANTSTDAAKNTLITFQCGKQTTQVKVNRGAPGPKGDPGPVGCKEANIVVKSDGKKAVCSKIFDNGKGDVGISTKKPRATLEVNNTVLVGTGAASGAITHRQDGVLEISGKSNHLSIVKRGLGKWPSKPAAGDRWAIDNVGGILGFWSLKYRLSLTPAGHLGINTRNPTGRLEVANELGRSVMKVMAGTGKYLDSDNITVFSKQNDTIEGGQILFEGAGNYQDWTIDVYKGDLRFFEPGGSRKNKKKSRGGIMFYISSTQKDGTSWEIPRLYIRNGLTESYQPLWIKSSSDFPITYQSTDNTWLYTQWYDSKRRRAWIGFTVNFSSYHFQLENDQGKGYFYFNRSVRSPRFIQTSDMRLKTDIEIVNDNILDKIDRLNLYSYKIKGLKNSALGLSADEVESVFPKLVTKNLEGYKGVDYSGLTAIAIGGIRELKRRVDELYKEMKKVDTEESPKNCKNLSKEREVAQLKKRVLSLEEKLRESEERYRKLQSKLEQLLQKVNSFEKSRKQR